MRFHLREAEYGLQDLQDALKKQKALAERYRSQYDELLRSVIRLFFNVGEFAA